MCTVIGHPELRTVYRSLPTITMIIRVTVKVCAILQIHSSFLLFLYVRLFVFIVGWSVMCDSHLGCRLIAQMFFFGNCTAKWDSGSGISQSRRVLWRLDRRLNVSEKHG